MLYTTWRFTYGEITYAGERCESTWSGPFCASSSSTNSAVEFQKRGEPETGRPYAERAVKFAAANFAARGALGRILLDTGDVPGAIRELEIAVKMEPNSPPLRFSLASAYSRAGRKEDAARQRAEFTRLKNLSESGPSREVRP